MANSNSIATDKRELRLFFHSVFTAEYTGLTASLGDYQKYQDLTSPQSPKVKSDFQNEPTFSPLTDAILNEVKLIGNELFQYREEYQYEITQMWMNCLKPGQSHHVHTHHNTMWSGVFYLNGEENEFPGINFGNPFYKQFVCSYKKLNEYNSNNWWVPAKKDKLVIFPSYMRHWVEPNNSTKERWGMSFNIMLRGRFEDESSLQSVVI